MKQKLFMESTEIDPLRTVGEITSELVRGGASQIVTAYKDGQISGVRFTLEINARTASFALPVRIDPIFRIINGRRKCQWDQKQSAPKDRQQAARVAWRQLLRWVQAQLAMIECGMVESGEVFMPYAEISPGGPTFWQHALEQGAFGKLLEAPK